MPDPPSTADASPVKRFFIDVLTQDIELLEAIPEFVDNSFDGADRIADGEDLSDYTIEINMTGEYLEILDDCGGIPLDISKEYAFRWGKVEDNDILPDSVVGEYGVGMKRALFRIGKHFVIETKTESDHYIIQVDAEEWRNDENNWVFPIQFIDDIEEYDSKLNQPGTRIYIDDLRSGVGSEFEKTNFESELKEELTSKSHDYLKRDLEIVLNGENLTYSPVEMIQDDLFDPAYNEFTWQGEEGAVDVSIKAGVGGREGEDAGWYVFCNGRLILESDTNDTTGWGVEMSNAMPDFHNQYYRFRGVVHFRSDDSGTLPWNTTKTGINEDTSVYKKARQEMVSTARPVIDFLNRVENQVREMDNESDEKTPLQQRMEDAEKVDSREVESKESSNFDSPVPEDYDGQETEDDTPGTTTIMYEKENPRIEAAKEWFDVTSAKAVGKETFEYFFEIEEIET